MIRKTSKQMAKEIRELANENLNLRTKVASQLLEMERMKFAMQDLMRTVTADDRHAKISDKKAATDAVNHPSHYTLGGIEVIDAIEAWQLGFRLASVVKYVARADHKGSRTTDLKKARWYLEREISKAEGK